MLKRGLFILVVVLCSISPAKAAGCSSTSYGNGVTCVQGSAGGGAGTSLGASFSTNVTANNLIVVAVTTNESSVTVSNASMTCTTLSASTSSPVKNSGNTQTFLYYGITTGGCQSVNFVVSSSVTATEEQTEWSGIKTTSPLDCDSTTGGTGNGTALTTGACSPTPQSGGSITGSMTSSVSGQWSMILSGFKTSTGSNDLFISAGGGGFSNATFTAGGSFAVVFQNGGTGHSAAMIAETQASGSVKRRRGSVIQ